MNIAKRFLYKGNMMVKKKPLTNKEITIAKCLVSGMSAKVISKNLGISLRTVEYYQKKIKAKLGCENTYQTGYKIGVILINDSSVLEKTNTSCTSRIEGELIF